MAKKTIKGEDGKVYTVKKEKPLYKKVWFWVVVLFVIGAIGNIFDGDDDKASNDSTPKVETTETTEKDEDESKEEEPKEELTIKLDNEEFSTDKDGKATITGTTMPNADVTVGYGIVGDSVKADSDGKFSLEHTLSNPEDEDLEINANLDGESAKSEVTVKASQEMIDQDAKDKDITNLSSDPSDEQRMILQDLAKQKFEQDYPYKGSKIHSIAGVIQPWTQNGDAWFYKAQATVVNAFGAEQDCVIEVTITPTGASSGNVELIAY